MGAYSAHGLDDGCSVVFVQPGEADLAAEVLQVVLVEDGHLAFPGDADEDWPQSPHQSIAQWRVDESGW